LDYGVPEPSNGRTVVRNSGAKIALTSEDEWYKAAYYDATRKQYLKSPTGSSAWTKCKYPASSVPNTANCLGSLLQAVALTPVGSYRASRSPYGTFDQGGNAFEWNEAIVIMRCSNSSACGLQLRGRRGGSFEDAPVNLFSVQRGYTDPINEFTTMGFRLVMILSTPGR
jgi:formylglycine-generating enzyme required for sulfatase activity